jgi:hypothetical protein
MLWRRATSASPMACWWADWMHPDRGRWCFLFKHHELVWYEESFGVGRDSYRSACPGNKTRHCRRCYHIDRSRSRVASKSSPHGSGPRSASNPERGWTPGACPAGDWPRDRRSEAERLSPYLSERAKIAHSSAESKVPSPARAQGRRWRKKKTGSRAADGGRCPETTQFLPAFGSTRRFARGL